MFDYIVGKINRAIANKEEKSKIPQNKIHKIGLLDIFGFENFEKNSFEQLCINYSNERLQQYFNNHIFKLEQETYKKEGIDWTQVKFTDNKNIIDLIDNGKISIFGLLDSEGITPNSNDKKFKNNVYDLLRNNQSLIDVSDNENKICINHYAGIIEYDIEGFVEKNLDALTNDISEALIQSKNKLIKKLLEKKDENKDNNNKQIIKKGISNYGKIPQKLQSDTLSKQFKGQLDELLQMLGQSNPRYVKCIKPNSLKKPLILESIDVMEQLLCAGVLEAIKIRKQGYNIRRSLEEFYKIYHILTPDIDVKNQGGDFKITVSKMMDIFMNLDEMKKVCQGEKKKIQIGKTKVFMKEEIKTILDYKLNKIKYIYFIQSVFRAMKVRKKVKKIINAITKIQNTFRGKLLREFYFVLKKQTIKIQKNFRYYKLKRNVNKMINHLEENKKKRLMEEISKNEKEGKNVQKLKEEINKIERESVLRIKAEKEREFIKQFTKNDEYKNSDNEENNYNSNNTNSTKVTRNKKFPKVKRKNKNKEIEEYLDEWDDYMKNLDVEGELKKKISILQEELENTKNERDKYKNEYEKIRLEYNLFKEEKEKNNSNSAKELIQKLKKEINEKETNLDIVTLQMDDLKKSKESLTELTENLKSQLIKRKEKFDNETQSLYKRIQELEIIKNDYENRLTNDTKEVRNSKSLFNINANMHEINDLKKENKQLQEKLNNLKKKSEKQINDFRKQIAFQEFKLKNVNDKEDYQKILNENNTYKSKINELQNQLNQEKQNSNTSNQDYSLLKDENENIKMQLEKNTHILEAFKKQLMEKVAELEQYKKINEEAREENDKLTDENITLKKEYNLIKTKINVCNADIQSRNDSNIIKIQLQMKKLENVNKELQEKIEKLKENLNKKNDILESKKKMNLLLIDLAKIKKNEVNCIEGLNLTKSDQLKNALITLRTKESILLAHLSEVTKEDKEIDDEDEEDNEEDDEEEGEEEGEEVEDDIE